MLTKNPQLSSINKSFVSKLLFFLFIITPVSSVKSLQGSNNGSDSHKTMSPYMYRGGSYIVFKDHVFQEVEKY